MTRMGRGIDRIEARIKVTGEALYTADVPVENVAYGVLVGSTVASGRIRRINTREVERMPGVLRVFTHMNTRYPGEVTPETVGELRLSFSDDRVHYVGQVIALVAADSLERAEEAASLVRAEYEEAAAVTTFEMGLPSVFTPTVDEGYVEAEPDTSRGNFEAAYADAPVRFEARYGTQKYHQTPIETYATTALWEDNRLILFESTQYVVGAQTGMASVLNMNPDNIHVVSNFTGGGFGAKGHLWPHTIRTAMAARELGRPLKVQLTRPQMQTGSAYQARTQQTIQLGATEAGDIRAVSHTNISQSGLDDRVEPATDLTRVLYDFPNLITRERLVRTNHNTGGAMRPPGDGPGLFALESALDELAHQLNMDPIELRRRNHADRDPDQDKPFSGKALLECYERGAERFGWAQRDPVPRSMRDGHELVGYGMASASRLQQAMECQAAVTLHADGSAVVATGVAEIGGGSYTTLAQVAAEDLTLPYNRVAFRGGDSTLPAASGSFGSMVSASTGSAVKLAAMDARAQAARLAVADSGSPLFGVAIEDVVAQDGRLVRRDNPNRGESYASILTRAGRETLRGHGRFVPNEESPFSSYAFGAQFAEVRVDELLGIVRVSRFVGAFAAGRILNEKTATSQAKGGIIYAIGTALMEGVHHDHTSGRLINANLFDYHVPVNADIPSSKLDVIFIDDGDTAVNLLGAKGIGEIVSIGVPAAIANAVFHATGKRVRELPLTPDKLL